jgi:predicted nucleotide-binding protein
MASNNKQQLLIHELKEFHAQLKRFRDLVEKVYIEKRDTGSAERQRESIREELVRKSGKLKPIVVRLTEKQYGQEFNEVFDIWIEALGADSYPPSQRWSLGALIDSVNEAIGRLEAEPELEKLFKITPPFESPKAFVAHGGKSVIRDKLESFLMALGVTPIIVEEQPSEGRSKDKNVEHYLKQSDCAIILATKGDVDGQTGEFIPRGNILIEIGRCQEILPDKIIYLLEEEAKFPTNIDEKVWERFTKESMDKAFIKIAKELRAFGLIRPIKPAG